MSPPAMQPPTTDIFITSEFLCLAAGTVVTILFLLLAIQSYRQSETPVANVLLALCSLSWNLGGLLHRVVVTSGNASDVTLSWLMMAMVIGMVGWPIPGLAIWRHHATQHWQRAGCRILQGVAIIMTAVAVFRFGSAALRGGDAGELREIKEAISDLFLYYGIGLLGFGAAILRWGGATSRLVWFSYITVLTGILGISLTIFLHHSLDLPPTFDFALLLLAKPSALMILLGSFFFSAHFRYADVFIRYSSWLLLAAGFAIALLVLGRPAPGADLPVSAAGGETTLRVFERSVIAAGLFIAFALAGRGMELFVERWLYRMPDYRNAARQFGETLGQLQQDHEVLRTVETTAASTLGLAFSRVLPAGELPPGVPVQAFSGEVVQLGRCASFCHPPATGEAELLVPIGSDGRIGHFLAVGSGRSRRALVGYEVSYLRSLTTQVGQRLDALRHERIQVEQRSRESRLRQQVTEAELRALRAQINPHFLFNTLNTIADLIVTDPPRAETMTLRLSQVFRHVLAHSARPFSSIHEEIDFVRACLSIEEARFGDRLSVEIEVAPEVASARIPSLILQPLVENALKHGLAPKLGPGRLRITAAARPGVIELAVEDDGVGTAFRWPPTAGDAIPAGPGRATGAGVGLRNVAERLRALYQDRGALKFESPATGGVRVTLRIPVGEAGSS